MTKDFVGSKAKAFHLPSVGGRRYSLSDFEGKWLLMVFHRHLG